jgi:lysozyme
MRTSQKGVDLIKSFEGCELRAYVCPAGVLTIGYGHTGPDVRSGQRISEEQAEQLLRDDLGRFEDGVAKHAGKASQGQFDAMVSLCFNIGIRAFAGSTVCKRHRTGDHARAADAFLMWNKGRVRGRLTVLPGLTRRRAAERRLYLS